MVHIDSTSLLNSVGSVGKVGVWFRRWHESNYGMGHAGCLGPQNFGAGQRKWHSRNVGDE